MNEPTTFESTDAWYPLDAEAALIGCCCMSRRAWVEADAVIDAPMISDEDLRAVWLGVGELHRRDAVVDHVTLRAAVPPHVATSQIATVLASVFTTIGVEQYAAVVVDAWRKRSIVRACQSAIQSLRDAEEGPADVAQRLATTVSRLLADRRAGHAKSLEDCLHECVAQLEQGTSALVPTGFDAIDRELGGFMPGETVLIGGRPSMGKSTLARSIAIRAAALGVPVAIVSLEEPRAKMARNMLSAEAGIDNNRLRKANGLGSGEWQRISNAVGKLAGLPVWMVDRVNTLRGIAAELSMLKAQHGIRLAIVDYLQLVQAGGATPYERAGQASVGLSQLFKSLEVVGIVAAQLSRESVKGDVKRPVMTDLRDSGQIEQDADAILLLHREDYYRLEDKAYQPTGEAELIVAKMRDGCRGKVIRLRSRLNQQAFDDIAAESPF